MSKTVPHKVVRQRRRLVYKESSEEGRHGHGRLLGRPLFGPGDDHSERRVHQSAAAAAVLELPPVSSEPVEIGLVVPGRQQAVVSEQDGELVSYA